MTSRTHRIKGFTAVEMLVVLLISGLIFAVLVSAFSKMITFFQHSVSHNQLQSQARDCMNTMTKFLQQGRADSSVISTPANNPPYSRIDFVLATDTTTAYAFYYSSGTVQMQVTKPGRNYSPQMLAQHVTALIFGGFSGDPATLAVTLRLDQNIAPNQVDTVLLPNQTIHMVETTQ